MRQQLIMMYTTPHLRGFTLIELLVTMALFTFVITIATGALFSAQAINTRLEQTQNVLDGVNLATELMVRDIRYGSNFYCASGNSVPLPLPTTRQDCAYPTGGSVLVFRPTAGLTGSTDVSQDRVAYFLSNNILYKTEFPFGGSSRTSQITTDSVKINTLTFFAKGLPTSLDTSADYNQPVVTTVISGTTVPPKASVAAVNFTIETSASARTLDK
jgi:prepilin-type N-terminal cleavage/methylation domain-containing protein